MICFIQVCALSGSYSSLFSRRSRYDIKILELLTIASMKQSLLQSTSSASKPGQSLFKTRVAFLILKVSPIFLATFWLLCKAASGVERFVIEINTTNSFALFFSDLGFPDCCLSAFVFFYEVAIEK